MNNVGSTTLLHPVFNNLEQVIISRRVAKMKFDNFMNVFQKRLTTGINFGIDYETLLFIQLTITKKIADQDGFLILSTKIHLRWLHITDIFCTMEGIL